MRFVQFGDAHLDSSISGKLNLPAQKRDVLRNDIRKAVSRACELVREHRADLVLVPGDLFDFECLARDTTEFLLDLTRRLTPIPVFISPGNHDSLKPGSPYVVASRIDWPSNVHIFREARFETVELPDLGCTVTGIGHIHRGVTERVLSAARQELRPSSVSLLVFHGSRDGYRPTEKEVVIPFSDAELLAQGFTYAAIGHYHSFGAIEDESGVRGAYSGCIQGRGLDEAGTKSVILGEIENGRVRLEQVEVAERRVLNVRAELTGARDVEGVAARAKAAAETVGARACDLVRIEIAGVGPLDCHVDWAAVEATLDFFHVVIDPRGLEPDYDLDALGQESAAEKIKSAFVRRMREMTDAANEEDRAVLRDATYYGLYALDGRKLEPRDAD